MILWRGGALLLSDIFTSLFVNGPVFSKIAMRTHVFIPPLQHTCTALVYWLYFYKIAVRISTPHLFLKSTLSCRNILTFPWLNFYLIIILLRVVDVFWAPKIRGVTPQDLRGTKRKISPCSSGWMDIPWYNLAKKILRNYNSIAPAAENSKRNFLKLYKLK